MIQLPENLDYLFANASSSEKEKWKNVIEMLDENGRPHTLDQIGIERIIRAAKKIKEEFPDTKVDLGFRHFILAEPEQNTVAITLYVFYFQNGHLKRAGITLMYLR